MSHFEILLRIRIFTSNIQYCVWPVNNPVQYFSILSLFSHNGLYLCTRNPITVEIFLLEAPN
jgi:hypothetical protein